jgi:hypothetical protein
VLDHFSGWQLSLIDLVTSLSPGAAHHACEAFNSGSPPLFDFLFDTCIGLFSLLQQNI